jgi:bleomycin hydrolase
MHRLLLIPFLFISLCLSAQDLTIKNLGLKPPATTCTPVKDQSMSSTCWSFSSTSLLESELMKMGKGQFDLSEMFIARYSMWRKIYWHLDVNGRTFLTPGGQFHDIIWVIRNHGIVPESVYSGKVNNEFSHNHAEMDTVVSRYIKDLVSKGVRSLDSEQMNILDSIQDHYMGRLPWEFTYNGKEYTPVSFSREVLGLNMDDFAEITSYTHHPFYTKFVLEDKYNWTSDKYHNVPLDDFSAITDHALANGFTVGWDGDATDTGFKYGEGLAYLPPVGADLQLARQTAFEDQTTLLDHMMHIVGSVKDKKGNKWYYIKNSWGNSNPLGGYLFMREDYFKLRTVAIIVNKQAIPTAIRAKMQL